MMDMKGLETLAQSALGSAGGVDLKSAAIGAVALKLGEPYLVQGVVWVLPRGVKWFLGLVKRNPAAAQVLKDHRKEFLDAFDAMDAAAKDELTEVPAPAAAAPAPKA